MRYIGLFVTVVIIFVIITKDTLAAPLYQRESLQGVDKLAVLVEDIPNDLTEAGLDKYQLEVDTELKLRLAKIAITGTDEPVPFLQDLYVQVSGIKMGEVGYAYGVVVSFKQPVVLMSSPGVVCIAVTWSSSRIGYFGSRATGTIVEKIRGVVKDIVDEFINDYLAARQELNKEQK